MYKSSGTVIVHPRDRSKGTDPLWVVLHIDDDLGDYLFSLTKKETQCWYALQKPAWKHHISIVRGELEAQVGSVFSFDGEIVEFSYDTNIYQAGGHFCVNCECPRVSEIRTSLGLSPEPPIPLHLTFAVVVQPSPHYGFWVREWPQVSEVI